MLGERNYSFKKSIRFFVNRNKSGLLDDRVWRCKDYCLIQKLGFKFLYLDESAASENLFPSHCYSKINESYIVTIPPKSEKIFCLLRISEEKIIGYQLFQESVKAEDYGAFIWQYIYMDNASTHKSQSIKFILDNMHVFYEAPYSPFLNPIEEVFGIWKTI